MPEIPPVCPGFGLGLRPAHYADFLERPQPVDFLEVISENFMVEGGRPLWTLDRIRRDYPVCLHGVSMSLGSADGLDPAYLKRLKALADRVDPLWVSDHLCWTGLGGLNSHDLLPLPLTDEALDRVASHIHQAQAALGRAMLIENPSSYVTFPEDAYSEWDFLKALCQRTGCFLLLDLNNVFVSGRNHGFDPAAYIAGLPLDRVRQVHLAGHTVTPDMLIDTHDTSVCDEVWDLFAATAPRLRDAAVMIERDDHIPPLPELLDELAVARRLAEAVPA